MKILSVSSNTLSASARVLPYIPLLTAAGHEVTVSSLGALSFKAIDAADVVWVSRTLLPQNYLDKLTSNHFVFDFDDALADYDPSQVQPFAQTMRAATVVLPGSLYLQGIATAAGARDARVLRTGVDTSTIKMPAPYVPRNGVLWLGSRTTVPYLEALEPVLLALPASTPVILMSDGFPQWQVKSKNVYWNKAQEVAALAMTTVGLAPLPDTPAARGKCAFKMVSYMAGGLPVVASNVGANAELFNDLGCQGALVDNVDDFGTALTSLLAMDPTARYQLGLQNRQIAVAQLDHTALFPTLLQALQDAAR